MDALKQSRHYFTLARHDHGSVLADLFFSLGNRWKKYGVLPMCENCRNTCKMAGADQPNEIVCYKFEKK